MLRRISSNATIAVIAPAFPADNAKTLAGMNYLRQKGFTVIEAPSLSGSWGYLSGSDEQRAAEINDFFKDDTVDAIFCARGGWGTLRVLDRLDYKRIRENPKLLVGYSDITSLQLAIWHKCRVPSLSGPMVSVEMGSGIEDFTAAHFWAQLENREESYRIELSGFGNIEYLTEGKCSGTLVGGCLSLIAHQLGTPYFPDFRDVILFIEDIGEKPYKIDRYLAQLKQSGVFEHIAGLIVGEFIDCEEESPSFSVKELIEQYTAGSVFPVVFNFPYGHGAHKVSMPVGVHAELDTAKKYISFSNLFI